MFSRMFRFQFLSLSIYILVTLWMVHVIALIHYFSKLVWHQVVWKKYQIPEGWKEKEPAVYKKKYNTRCSFHQNDKPFKGDPIEESRETCTTFGKWLNIQICPFADFKWLFWQYLCNKKIFLLWIFHSGSLYQKREEKGWLMTITFLPQTQTARHKMVACWEFIFYSISVDVFSFGSPVREMAVSLSFAVSLIVESRVNTKGCI